MSENIRKDERPLAIDLFCGAFGWGAGCIAEGWRVVGFDLMDVQAELGIERAAGCQLVIQDVRTIHGSQFRDARLITASPPCQFFSWTAMPWSRAKRRAEEVRNDPELLAKELELFQTCFRIQREASEAAGRHIPMVVENVRGAQKWVGRSAWRYGSYHLWGDVPALMPFTCQAPKRALDDVRAGVRRHAPDGAAHLNDGGSWFNVAHNTTSGKGRNPVNDGFKHRDQDGYDRIHPESFGWKAPRTSPKSPKRKAASALIAKIPLPLARHIAAVYREAA